MNLESRHGLKWTTLAITSKKSKQTRGGQNQQTTGSWRAYTQKLTDASRKKKKVQTNDTDARHIC
jgi:hypothetical protein